MKLLNQHWIAATILVAVFTLGFLAGISSARPLKAVFPTRSAAHDPQPEEFVEVFTSRLTSELELTAEQVPLVEAQLRDMATEIRNIQRSFIPRITGSLTNAIDKILPLLNEEQQATLKRRQESVINNSPISRIGAFRPSNGIGNGNGNGPPRGRFGPPGGRPPNGRPPQR